MFCSKCGKENDGNAKYCIHCGNNLAKNEDTINLNSSSNELKNDNKSNFSKIGNFFRWFLGFILIVPGGFIQANPFSILLGATIIPLEYKIVSKNVRIAIGIISFFGIGIWAGVQSTPNNISHQQKEATQQLSTPKKEINTIPQSFQPEKKIKDEIKPNYPQKEDNNIITEENKKNVEMLLKKVKKTVDDIEDRIVYESWNSIENNRDDCYLKLIQSKKTNQCVLFWYIDYYNTKTPLFIRYFTVKADDFKEQVSIPLMDVHHELFMEKIVLSYENNKDVLNAIANSKNTTIRFQGMHYYDDRKLSSAKINAIKDMLSLYQLCIDGYL